jgi:hypothetical protein
MYVNEPLSGIYPTYCVTRTVTQLFFHPVMRHSSHSSAVLYSSSMFRTASRYRIYSTPFAITFGSTNSNSTPYTMFPIILSFSVYSPPVISSFRYGGVLFPFSVTMSVNCGRISPSLCSSFTASIYSGSTSRHSDTSFRNTASSLKTFFSGTAQASPLHLRSSSE